MPAQLAPERISRKRIASSNSRTWRELPISRPRTALLVSFLVLLALCSLASADEARYVIEGDRITLKVPVSLSAEAAQALLEDRELALAYVESVLGCSTADTPLNVEVSFSLFGGTPGAFTLHNLIVFPLSFARRDRFESKGTIPHTELGCHEETHVVAALCWGWGTHAMTEGLAVYLDRAYRGGAIYLEVALGLLERGDLPSLQSMLQAQLSTHPATNNSTLIYQGGASFVAFVLDVYGMDALREFYWRSCLPTAYLEDQAQRIFGRSLAELDAEWQEYLAAKGTATRYAAAMCLEAWDRQYAVLGELQAQLGSLADTSEPAVLGRSEPCEAVNSRLNELAKEILFAQTDQQADTASNAHQTAIEESKHLLGEWLTAAEAFQEFHDGNGDTEELAQLLDRAEAGYLAVGDHTMVEAVRAARESQL